MNTELERRKQEITRSQGRRKLWQRIVSALAAVVMFVTTYVLILPVEAQNRTFCEKEAHEHSAENGCYVETKTLKCEEKHEHTDECYITLLTLICQHEEHVHNKECYADKTADIETQADWEASIKAAKLTGEWSKDIISIASTQLGYRESERNYILGENNEIKGYTRYGDWIGDKYVDWSAAFVAFCVNYTGIDKDEMTYDKVPEQWMELMKSAKLFNENITETNPGDIVFVDENGDNKADRVGIVVEQSEDKIKTVEGDLNNAVSYFEYELSAQTARADVDSSNEESKNNKDFSEEKSTTGRAARAEEKPNIIGSVSLPKNPNYNPPIAITDPENPDATSEPGNRVNPTSSPENRVTPTTPPENRGITRASVPTLTNLDPATKVALIFDNGGSQRIQQFTTLTDAIKYIDTYSLAQECTIVFVQNYTVNNNDRTELMKQTPATQINFTSTYNNGSAEIVRNVGYADVTGANTQYSCDVVLHHISINTQGYHNFYARGYKFLVDETVTASASSKLRLLGGSYQAPHPSAVHTGNPEIIVLGGRWDLIHGGCGEGAMTANPTITIGGSAVVDTVAAGSYAQQITGNATVNIKDQAVVTTINAAYGNINSGSVITYNIDGSNGAKVTTISGRQTHPNGTINAGAELYINIKNIKDVTYLFADSTYGSGKITVEGDCHAKWGIVTNANIDVELAENATLQLGSSADLATPGNADAHHGMMRLLKSIIMNANSKLTVAGDGYNNDYRVIKDIDVRGAGAEIDIFKRAATTYPLRISGQKLGSDKLKLGIFINPNDTATQIQGYNEVLLIYSSEPNATEEDYLNGQNVTDIYKRGAEIVTCLILDNVIDVEHGRIVFSSENATQYVDNTNNIYAKDDALKDAYTLTGSYYGTTAAKWVADKPFCQIEPGLQLDLTLDDLYIKNYLGSCINCTEADVTMTLVGETTLSTYTGDNTPPGQVVSGAYYYSTKAAEAGIKYIGGCIEKNGMEGTLVIQCEFIRNHPNPNDPARINHRCDDSCGSLATRPTGVHAASIGSTISGMWQGKGGCSHIYFEGGNITATASSHSPAIGTICSTWIFDENGKSGIEYSNIRQWKGPQDAVNGQFFSDVSFKHARVYAVGGEICSAIGTGYFGRIDGLTISDGAYIEAHGGYNAPGIGVGGNSYVYTNNTEHPLHSVHTPKGYYTETPLNSFKNFSVSGGSTVVKAFGGISTYAGIPYVAGIGNPIDFRLGYIGVMTNTYAQADKGYVTVIKQGPSANESAASFIPGAPADANTKLDIIANQYYTLVYFTQVSKTASVNGGAEDTGTFDTPVSVQEGDTIKYIIRTGEIADANGAVSGEVSDVIPEGLTYVPGSASGNGSYDAATRTVKWTNQTFSSAHEFSFEVTVDQLAPGVLIKRYENQGALTHSDGTNTIPLNSNQTYHVVEKDPDIAAVSFKKVLPNGTGLAGAGFSAFSCTNTAAGHTHGDGCTWNASSPIETAALSDAQGRVYFNSLIVDNIYILTESTVPSGYLTPSDESYLVLNIAADKSYTITGYGDFAIIGTVTHDGSVYSIKNIPDKYNFTLKKFVSGGAAGESFRFEVVIMNGSDILIWSDMSKLKVFDENGDPVANAASVSPAGVISFDLADGWRFEIEGVPTYYTVTVEEKNYDGYDVRIVGAAEAAAGKTEAIVMDDNKTVSYYNTRSVRDLTIEKTVQGSTTTEKFSFSVLIEDKNGQPVIIPEQYVGGADPHDPNYDPNNPGVKLFEVDQTTGEVTFEIANGESMLLPGIPVGSSVTVTETSHAGYTVQYNFSDGTPSVSGDTAEVTIADDLTVTCINNAGFELPHTGGTGSLILTLGGVILVATALMYGISAKRRQWRAWI